MCVCVCCLDDAYMSQVEWLNCYHSTCLQLVGECLAEQGRGEALQWLSRETTPLG